MLSLRFITTYAVLYRTASQVYCGGAGGRTRVRSTSRVASPCSVALSGFARCGCGATRAARAIVRVYRTRSGTIRYWHEPSGFRCCFHTRDGARASSREWSCARHYPAMVPLLGSHCVAERVGILPSLVVFTSSTSKLGMQLRRLSYSVESMSPPFCCKRRRKASTIFQRYR